MSDNVHSHPICEESEVGELCLSSGSPPTAPEIQFAGSDRAPLVELVQRYRADGAVPFSGPGHKLGAGAAPELLDLMGGVFGSDVWLDTGGFDRALRDAEALAADVWGSETLLLPRQRLLQRQPRLPARHPRSRRRGRRRPRPAQVPPSGLHPDRGPAGVRGPPAAPTRRRGRRPPRRCRRRPRRPSGGPAGRRHQPQLLRGGGRPASGGRRRPQPVRPGVCRRGLGAAPRLSPTAAVLGHGRQGRRRRHQHAQAAEQPQPEQHPQHPLGPAAAGRLEAAVRLHPDHQSPAAPARLGRRLPPADGRQRPGAAGASPRAGRDGRRRLRRLPGLRLLDADSLSLARHRFDPTRLVVDVTGLGLTGLVAERVLREGCALAPEGSDLSSVVCLSPSATATAASTSWSARSPSCAPGAPRLPARPPRPAPRDR